MSNIESFVLKINNTCCCRGVFIFLKQIDDLTFFEILSKKVYNFADINKLIINNKDILIEESLVRDGVIPYDMKIFCNNCDIICCLILSRNNENVMSVIYDFNKDDFIKEHDFFYHGCPFNYDYDLKNHVSFFMDNISKIKSFCKIVLNKIKYNNVIRLDLYIVNNIIYLGEFTLHPGVLHFHYITPKYIYPLLN